MTLAEIIAIANEDTTFIAGSSSNEIWFGNNTSVRLTDAVADVARAAQGKADSDHTHTGYAPENHTHDGYAPSEHTHTGFAAENHSHDAYEADAITAHLSDSYYPAPAGDAYTTIPLNSSVVAGDGFTIVNNQIRIGAGISKVMISAQLCVGSSNIASNKFIAIRKNATSQLARAQMKLCENTTPQTMAIPCLLVNVSEGDLLTLDFYGKLSDTIYGDNVLTYLTVQKIA